MPDELRDLLIRPRYSFAESDRLAAATRGTSKRWLAGYEYVSEERGVRRQPPVTAPAAGREAVSFLDLVEVAAIAGLRGEGFSLGQIRSIAKNCQEVLGVERPLASLKFKTGGRDIFVDVGEQLIEVGRHKRQLAWNDVLQPFLANLDYSSEIGFAMRWWPHGRSVPIVVDPAFGFGFPVIQGSGVRTEIILERFRAGDLHDQIAADFSLDPVEVERALQFELKRAA